MLRTVKEILRLDWGREVPLCSVLLTVDTLQQVFPTVVGDMDSGGSLNAQVLLLLAERLRAKAVFQVTGVPTFIH